MPTWPERIAVITGAGSGIGLATARLFAEMGAFVHLVDIDGQRALAGSEQIAAQGGRAVAHAADCSDAAQMERLARDIFERQGRVDILVNNAGICVAGPISSLAVSDWRRVIDVNLFGVALGVHFFAREMIRAGSGHVVNIASAAGLFALPLLAPYAASKFGALGLSLCLSAELEAHGIGVTTVCPGAVSTDILRAARLELPEVASAKIAAVFARFAVPPERIASDIKRAIDRRQRLVLRLGAMRPLLWLHRFCPALYRAAMAWLTRRAMQKLGLCPEK